MESGLLIIVLWQLKAKCSTSNDKSFVHLYKLWQYLQPYLSIRKESILLLCERSIPPQWVAWTLAFQSEDELANEFQLCKFHPPIFG